jgi:hypothetical protein
MDLLYEHEVNYISFKFSRGSLVLFRNIRIGDHDYFFNPNRKNTLGNIRCYGVTKSNNLLIEPDTKTEYEFAV